MRSKRRVDDLSVWHGLQESFSEDPRCGESDPRDHSQLREVRLEWAG